MRAIQLVAPKTFEIVEREIPVAGKNQVVIKVEACGICSSEVPIYDGSLVGTPGVSFRYTTFPADLGHEVVGTVYEVGSEVENLQLGDKVTGLTYSGCGFAEYFLEQEQMLIKIPDSYNKPLKYAIGEPLVATVNIMRQMSYEFGDTILIVGDGYMSLLLVAALKRATTKNLIVVGHHDERLALALKYGASIVINGKNNNAWQAIMDLTNGQGVDISVEYAGTSKSLELAASVCKAKVRSKLVLAAAYDNKMPFTIGNYLQNRAPIVIPAYPNQSTNKRFDMERAMWALGEGLFPIEDLISHEYKLTEVGQGYQDCVVRLAGYRKGIVVPFN